ncbi:rubredoxin-like domain-containing protein [Thermodesulfobacteriota bacterium]
MFRCKGCGYIDDERAPDVCPKCGAKKDAFLQLADDAAELIDKSRCTNFIHMEIASLANSILALSESGIEENLDPNCVKLFNYAYDQSTIIKQMINAELEGHMNKKKWG